MHRFKNPKLQVPFTEPSTKFVGKVNLVRKPKRGPHFKGEGVFHNFEASHFEPEEDFYLDHILELHPVD